MLTDEGNYVRLSKYEDEIYEAIYGLPPYNW